MSTTLPFVVVGKKWVVSFARERSRILEAPGDHALDIQHLGSAAIPGIAAKPLLDIAVAIRNSETN